MRVFYTLLFLKTKWHRKHYPDERNVKNTKSISHYVKKKLLCFKVTLTTWFFIILAWMKFHITLRFRFKWLEFTNTKTKWFFFVCLFVFVLFCFVLFLILVKNNYYYHLIYQQLLNNNNGNLFCVNIQQDCCSRRIDTSLQNKNGTNCQWQRDMSSLQHSKEK